MTNSDSWWASIPTSEKERIAAKIVEKTTLFEKPQDVTYPNCTRIWLAVPDAQRNWIYRHSVEKHDLAQADWTEGNTLSY